MKIVRVTPTGFAPVEIPEGAVHKMTKGEISDFAAQLEEQLKDAYTRPTDYGGYPGNKVYATVKVNGKTVATLYNSGAMETSNAIGARFEGSLPNNGQGPSLAQVRAEFIAKKLGGTVENAPTALTQRQYDRLPSMTLELDETAMKQDTLYGLLRSLLAAQETAGARTAG